MTVTEPGSIDIPMKGDLRECVLHELDRIAAELDIPFTTGLIPRTLIAHLRGVVDAWPMRSTEHLERNSSDHLIQGLTTRAKENEV